MRISVILSTYNAPQALELALWGHAAQRPARAFEVVLADDGSGPETRELVERLRPALGFAVVHLWQEDAGFRKCRILNRAIEAAAGEYLVFSDGDCIPRNDFVAAHAALAAPGRFVSGGRVRVAGGGAPDRRAVLDGSLFRAARLRDAGLVPMRPRDLRKLARSPRRAAWLDRLTPTRATWNGHNASGWKSDLLRVNGFDERMTYPVEDRELGERLRKAGVRPIQARHRAVCVHLEHGRPWLDPAAQACNQRLRARTRGVPRWLGRLEWLAAGRDWTEHGIRKGPRRADRG